MICNLEGGLICNLEGGLICNSEEGLTCNLDYWDHITTWEDNLNTHKRSNILLKGYNGLLGSIVLLLIYHQYLRE